LAPDKFYGLKVSHNGIVAGALSWTLLGEHTLLTQMH